MNQSCMWVFIPSSCIVMTFVLCQLKEQTLIRVTGCPLLLAKPPLPHCNDSVSYRCHWTPLLETGLIGYSRIHGSLEAMEVVRSPFPRLPSFAYWPQITRICHCLSGSIKVTGNFRWISFWRHWTKELNVCLTQVTSSYCLHMWG